MSACWDLWRTSLSICSRGRGREDQQQVKDARTASQQLWLAQRRGKRGTTPRYVTALPPHSLTQESGSSALDFIPHLLLNPLHLSSIAREVVLEQPDRSLGRLQGTRGGEGERGNVEGRSR
jgi:hypothetical protein